MPAESRLKHDDLILPDDGSAVEIGAAPEALLEVRGEDPATLARAAWLLGDHHIPVEIHPRYVRLLRTESALLADMDVSLRDIEAPLEPKGGAYDHAAV